MRILITNNRLDLRGGAESYLRDLARGLQRLGHTVLAYSSDLGEQERLLEYDSVPVATDLENLPFLPDVIHGQHHLDAMTALLSLPGVPALYHCHGAVWRECAPRHPRIYRYLAMSRTLKERMMAESCIPEDRIELHLNGVDVERFKTIRELPDRPRKALFYNSHHRPESATLAAIREACARLRLELDCVGQRVGGRFDRPEEELPRYDVVFAAGRSAIDAMASGCAVVVIGRTTCGELVNQENYDRFRTVNFSMAVNSAPARVEEIAQQVERYSAVDAAQVTSRLRRDADSSLLVENLVRTYAHIIREHASAPADPAAELKAAGRYLRRLVPVIKMTDDAQHQDGLPMSRAVALRDLREQLELVHKELPDLR